MCDLVPVNRHPFRMEIGSEITENCTRKKQDDDHASYDPFGVQSQIKKGEGEPDRRTAINATAGKVFHRKHEHDHADTDQNTAELNFIEFH